MAHHDDQVSIETIAKALELQVRNNYFVNEVVRKRHDMTFALSLLNYFVWGATLLMLR